MLAGPVAGWTAVHAASPDPAGDVPFAAQTSDPADALLDDIAELKVDLTRISRAEWAPEHAGAKPSDAAAAAPRDAASKTDASKTAASKTDASKPARDADKGEDPEPDGATVPSTTTSNDPLDKPGAKPAAAQAEEPLTPLNAAIKAALDKRGASDMRGRFAGEKRKEREAIAFFYAAHGFAPAWSENGLAIAAVEPVLNRLAHADDDALTIGAVPKALKVDGKLEDIAETDIALTEAVVAYARQASGSRIIPSSISPLIGAKPELVDPGEVVDNLIVSGAQAGEKLQAMNPTEPRYLALRDKLMELNGARAAPGPEPITDGPTLRVGMQDARVPALRTRLGVDAPPADGLGSGDPLAYDVEIADAVADFQRDHGIIASGALTKRTVAALNGGPTRGPAAMQAILAANMEMWRWMPHDLGSDRIEVNVPDFVVTVFHDGEPVAKNRVVVGKTDTPTPLFSNTMKYLIVNPMWNVPQSIIKKEMMPKGGGSVDYLQGRGYNVSYRNGMISVQQLSGPKNALGRIKFMFPNDYSVYLHDTPSKNLFGAAKRAFSHGCVRVDQPFDFAQSVLNDGVPEGGRILWSRTRLDKMLGDKERYVNLPKPLPIHIEYFTASVDPESGRIVTRDDVYGYIRAVAEALGTSGNAPEVVATRRPKRVVERTTRRPAEIVVDSSDPR